MFKLVGKEHFTVGKAKCCITIEAVSGFAYEYSLEVNGKSLKKFTENLSKIMRTWVLTVSGIPTRVVLGMYLFINNCIIYIVVEKYTGLMANNF